MQPLRGMKVMVVVVSLAACATGPEVSPAMQPKHVNIEVPETLRVEHEEIHEALIAATKQPGRVGEAARELAAVLHPHFQREQEIALPPLALLAPLSRGETSSKMRDVLPMTDALRTELPEMLREHEKIGAAARHLEEVAREAHDERVVELAEKLQLHARSEEEIFYPAAILVGDLVKARTRP